MDESKSPLSQNLSLLSTKGRRGRALALAASVWPQEGWPKKLMPVCPLGREARWSLRCAGGEEGEKKESGRDIHEPYIITISL